ncbi:MAG: aminotransferase class V-fold PLP-dependent enzyme, partial [Verrucomicrobia bacterium]|nr:aminotransferase class V-fold PLP-dependent enzyme [Verrucomicrobiota bacterium]
RRHEFPVTRDKIFLAHAGDCPLPRRVAEAVADYAHEYASGDQEKFVYPAILDQGRKLAAQLLKCQPEEVAFVGPTSLALSFLASGLKLRRGDNILIYFEDYPSNVYPWMALAEQGVEVRLMNTRGLGAIRPIDVMGQVDENTRLVALASCHCISGYRLDFQAKGKYLRDRNILFCLDAIQTLGAFPTTVEYVDLQEQIVLRTGSQKYEAGTHNLLGIVGLVTAMGLIVELGVDNIARELQRKRARLVPALQVKGCTVAQADAPAEAGSAIISFTRPGSDLAALHQKLLDAAVVTSLRTDRTGQKYIRLSPHFYNTDAELERVLELVT